ncbi:MULTISPECIES: SSI family serine proteinase inhibitor [unclassified Streptomyces]|uniref:SSI family serine proteinase inhibitor n=1 Tax=unclassified Streptomyces TaxID=2593676 RepID=UPI00344CF11E
MKKIMMGVLGAGLLAAVLTPSASAVPAYVPGEDAHIQLTVARPLPDGVQEIGFIWLDCPGPEAGGHPHGRQACRDLDAARGDFGRLRGERGRSCTAEHAPVTVTAHGTYRGRAVHWERTYGNECLLTVETGPVFAF